MKNVHVLLITMILLLNGINSITMEPADVNPATLATQNLQETIDELEPYRFSLSFYEDTAEEKKKYELELIEEIKGLLAQGADVDTVNNDGRTILSVAVHSDFKDMVKFLIVKNASTIHPVEWPPLIDAAALGYEDIVDLLVDAGAWINQQAGSNGVTALMMAVSAGQKNIADLLISKGADLALRNKAGETAQDFAQDQPEMMELLITKRIP